MKEEWLMSGAVVPVDVETTAALVVEIHRLIDVVGGMALAQPDHTEDLLDMVAQQDAEAHLQAVSDFGQLQEQSEPVAWQFMYGSNFRKRRPDDFADLNSDGLPYWKPLYTSPPKRQPLTDEDLELICAKALFCRVSFQQFARAIEAAHGIGDKT